MKEITIFSILVLCARWIPWLPLLIYLWKYRALNKPLKVLGFQLVLAVVMEQVSYYYAKRYDTNTPLQHLYVVLELFSITVLYYYLMKGRLIRRAIWIVSSTAFVFSIFNSLFIQLLSVSNTYAQSVSSLVFIGYALTGFYIIFTQMKIQRLAASFEFWIHTGVLMYFSCNLFLFISSNTILKLSTKTHYMVWGSIHAVFDVFLYLSLAIALWYGTGTERKHLLYSFRRHRGNVPPGNGDHSIRSDLPEEIDPPPAEDTGNAAGSATGAALHAHTGAGRGTKPRSR